MTLPFACDVPRKDLIDWAVRQALKSPEEAKALQRSYIAYRSRTVGRVRGRFPPRLKEFRALVRNRIVTYLMRHGRPIQ